MRDHGRLVFWRCRDPNCDFECMEQAVSSDIPLYGADFTIEEICLWYYFHIKKGPACGYCKEKDRTGYDLLEFRYVKGADRQKCTVRCREHIAHEVMLFSSAKVENVPDQESIAESKGTDTWAEGHNISVQVWLFVIIALMEGIPVGIIAKLAHVSDEGVQSIVSKICRLCNWVNIVILAAQGDNIVEAQWDETAKGKRKYHKGKRTNQRGVTWIHGGRWITYDGVKYYLARIVEARARKDLMPTIDFIASKGMVLYTDGWKAYTSARPHDCDCNDNDVCQCTIHRTVNHSKEFVAKYKDKDGKEHVVHSNAAEALWSQAKRMLRARWPTTKGPLGVLNDHLQFCIFKIMCTSNEVNPLRFLFKCIAMIDMIVEIKTIAHLLNVPYLHIDSTKAGQSAEAALVVAGHVLQVDDDEVKARELTDNDNEEEDEEVEEARMNLKESRDDEYFEIIDRKEGKGAGEVNAGEAKEADEANQRRLGSKAPRSPSAVPQQPPRPGRVDATRRTASMDTEIEEDSGGEDDADMRMYDRVQRATELTQTPPGSEEHPTDVFPPPSTTSVRGRSSHTAVTGHYPRTHNTNSTPSAASSFRGRIAPTRT